MKPFKQERDASGFTLIEVLVVVVILGILAAVVLVAIGGLDTQAKKNSCTTESATIRHAVLAFKAAHPSLTLGGAGATQQTIVSDLTQSTNFNGAPGSVPNSLDNGVQVMALLQAVPKQNSANGYWNTGAWSAGSTTPAWRINTAANNTIEIDTGCTQ